MSSKTTSSAAKPNKLTPFHDRISEQCTISRFNWSRPGGPRESLHEQILKKLRPPTGRASDAAAAAVQLLVPTTAPQDYFNLDFLVRHYEASLPANETIAYVQVTLRFGAEPNLHAPFEVVREWVRAEFCSEGLPAAVILHHPALVGSSNDGHVHVLIFPRVVNQLGWCTLVRDIANDAGRKAIWMSWQDHWEAAN